MMYLTNNPLVRLRSSSKKRKGYWTNFSSFPLFSFGKGFLLSSFLTLGDASVLLGIGFLSRVICRWVFVHDSFASHGLQGVESYSHILLSIGLFIAVRLLCGDYRLAKPKDSSNLFYQLGMSWVSCCAVSVLILIGLIPIVSVDTLEPLVFALVGSIGIIAWRGVIGQWLNTHPEIAQVASKRVFLIGFEEDVEAFRTLQGGKELQMRIIGSTVLRKTSVPALQQEDLSLAVSIIRFLRPEDIVILLPWSQEELLENTIQTLRSVPAGLYLWPAHALSGLSAARFSALGKLPAIKIGQAPLTAAQRWCKRLVDIVLSGTALVLLSPVFLLTALAIRLDSKGPVFYVQRRYGFNQEPFAMLKFRSMRFEPKAGFKQAVRNDPRVTRVGKFIRKWNIDELPQLINVLCGDMSLVGPRPHAMAHDQQYMSRIGDYAHRHNVRPGITGWAQVNGLRGETSTDAAMIQRVEHDIYYIAHWSLGLDLWILFMTVVSPRAYSNAC